MPAVRRCTSSLLSALLMLTCAFAFFALSPDASGQIDQGGISGTVQDPSGAVVPNATITLTNADTGLQLVRKADASGFYVFTPLKIGRYSLVVAAEGFESAKRDGIQVDVSQRVAINMTLKPGSTNETVTVTSTPELQTEDASTGQVFSAQVINDTPLDGRNYVFIAQLTTGVAAPNQGFGQVAGAGDFTSNGNRVTQNNFILDGVDNNSNMQDFLNGATYAVRPPPDALAEFKVQSSDYSAELGRSTGAAINASIKSGTNQFHGSLWEYYRSDRMAAIDFFNNGSTAYHQNQFGATLGGPIWKNKLFFFADAQGTRISSFLPAQPNNTVPTDAIRNGDFSEMLDPGNTTDKGIIHLYQVGGNPTSAPGVTEDSNVTQRYLTCNGAQNVICAGQVNPIAQRILKLFPEPNAGAPHQVFNNYTIPARPFSNNTTQYDLRVDYNPSASDQGFARYSYSNNPTTYAPPFPILDGGSFGTSGQNSNYGKSGVVSETHFFSPTLSNEFRAGFNWLHASYLQDNSNVNLAAQLGLGGIPFGPNLGGLPDLGFGATTGVGGYLNNVGVAGYVPSSETQNVLQLIDNVSKIWGQHSVKFGVDFQHIRFYGLQPPNGLGSQSYNGTYTSDPGNPKVLSGSAPADFLLDMMNSSSITSVTPITDLRWYESAYVQDDWKVTPRLTLNLGLRWEYNQPIRELNDRQANFVGNFAGMNQGSGTYLIPRSQENFPIPTQLQEAFTADNIKIQYVSNQYLVNPRKLNFAPRVGVAFQPDAKTVIRAGGGVFFGGLENIGLGLNLGNNAPFFVTANFIPNPQLCQNINGAVTCPTNSQTLETGFSAALDAPNGGLVNFAQLPTIYTADQNAKSAYTVSYNLSFQRSLTNSLSYTINYQGNQSKHLQVSYNANQFPGVLPRGVNGQDYQPFHDFNITSVANQGLGRYDSLQAKMEKRYTHGLYFLAGYTWAHCLDDAFGPIGQSNYGGYRNPNFLGFRYDYGSCTQDVRNRFTFSPQYELPFGAGKRFLNHGGITDALVGGWKTSLIFQVQSGNPVFLTSSNQGSSYPIRVSDQFSAGGTANPATQPQFSCAAKTRSLQSWYNPCAFVNPPQAVIGDDNPASNQISLAHAGTLPFGPPGRVSVTGPGFNQLDMSLFKSFRIPFRESALQLRGDAFNLLNHPSFGNPNNGLQGSTASSITSTRFSSIQPNARVIQVAMRYSF